MKPLEEQPTLLDIPSAVQMEWEGMPEFIQEDLTPHRVINVRFRNDDDVKEFERLMGQSITPKQKTIWFPYAEHRRASIYRYVDEP